ncbi:hypothetical protein FJM67_09460 [Maribrevibacterium harenarium]|uniref:DUF4386 family protein n=1 Tax=Maribrevibacterium harenarium TaxID=2589817 RepID=A0A501WSC9_9GAMM|nr:hypothetical protein [Maribrevibacterium harenarium]TPE51260.1 hypothetical protein FJM67_09460 [Maribrevibacterium harenarium]
MKPSIRCGGISAIIAALTFLFGMAYYLVLMTDIQYGNLSSNIDEQLSYLSAHHTMIYVWYFIIYIVFGFALLGLQIGLSSLLPKSALSQATAIVAYIWVGLVIGAGMVANVGSAMSIQLNQVNPQAASHAWVSVQIVLNGLGGGNEIVGGVWLVLLFFACGNSNCLPNAARLGALAIGCCGIATAIPVLTELGAVFGLGCILWFLSTGLYMLLNKEK